MERYVWGFNGKTYSEEDKILIKKGENVRFIFQNKTMMHHPLHLHGHFFRVLNGQGDYSPLKHTVDVPPLGHVEIEFLANEEKDWFFHCHNLYHMKSGMTRVVRYIGTKTDPKLIAAAKRSKVNFKADPYYRVGNLGIYSNLSRGMVRFFNNKNAFEFEYEHGFEDEYEAELVYERLITRYFEVFGGVEVEKEGSMKSEREAIIGINYVLPLLIDAKLSLDTDGESALFFSSMLQLTDRFQFNWNAGWEYDDDENKYEFEAELELEYRYNKSFSAVGNWDNEEKLGIGINYRF